MLMFSSMTLDQELLKKALLMNMFGQQYNIVL